MKGPLTALALLAVAPALPAAAGDVPLVPPELALAATSGAHRLLAFQHCSEENCWHRFYVQKLGLSPHRKILCSRPVVELNRHENTTARHAHWQSGAFPVLELALHSLQDEFVPYMATLAFAGDCRYELQPASPPPLETTPSVPHTP